MLDELPVPRSRDHDSALRKNKEDVFLLSSLPVYGNEFSIEFFDDTSISFDGSRDARVISCVRSDVFSEVLKYRDD
jgi:hypothetical protein